jgi:hypothetical protein
MTVPDDGNGVTLGQKTFAMKEDGLALYRGSGNPTFKIIALLKSTSSEQIRPANHRLGR